MVNMQDSKGRTPLHAAAFTDQGEALQILLCNQADVNKADHCGRTPLMYAAANGHVSAVELLLSNGADVNLSDVEKNTALHHACFQSREEVALIIIDKMDSMGVNMANVDLTMPLHIAAKNGLVPVVQDLIIRGASVLALDDKGHTPALSCAPNNRVADCLALILANMPSGSLHNHTLPRTSRNADTSSSSYGMTRTLETVEQGSPASSLVDVKDHSGSHQSSDSEFY